MSSTRFLPNSILIRIRATHFNDFINRNSLNYTADAVSEGAKSWVTPFNKPQLVGHDKLSDPIGRIVAYRIARSDSVEEPADYVELLAKITDQDSIAKILDGRFNTVSVGSRSSRVLCSECGQNIIEDGLCEHKKGSYDSKGKRIHWIIDQIEYVECSFVNEPADDWAGIDQIDVGFGFVPYKDFLDNQEVLVTELDVKDNVMNDAKLTSKARKGLPDSAFCYVAGSGENKVRKFPAHDAAHVRNGLARLSQANLPEGARSRVLACLKRRAKRFGVKVSKDEVFSEEMVNIINSLDPLFGINDEWTQDEHDAIKALFDETPDFDVIPETKEEPKDEEENKDEVEPEKMKKDELVTAYKKLQEDSKAENEAKDKKIQELESKVSEQATLLTEREDEVNKYIDQAASLEKKLRDSIINNIIDLKKSDTNEDRASEVQKLESRQLQSLVDTLADLRIETTNTEETVESQGRIQDPAQQPAGSTNKDQQEANTKKDPWSIFGEDNRLVEVE